MSLVSKGKRNSFNIGRGDIIRVCAGTTAYLINRDNNENLLIAKLLIPVSTPGQFQVRKFSVPIFNSSTNNVCLYICLMQPFFGPGGRENPESFYSAFSSEILEAALNVS